MLTFERANELFRYDPISGKVFRKVTISSRSIKGTEAGSLDKRERICVSQLMGWVINYTG